MALITDLPAASSLADTDLLVIDTGSTTQKITAANAASGMLSAGGVVDYVTLETTSGIWTYRQWASGIAECWGKYSEGTAAAFDPVGNVFYRVLSAITIPAGWFISAPVVTTGIDFGNIGSAQAAVQSATRIVVAVMSASASERACSISLHCVGRWKA